MRAFFRTPLIALSGLVALASLTACNKTQPASGSLPASSSTAAAQPVATVNGSPISRTEYDLYVRNLLQGKQKELTAEEKNQVLDDLINMDVLAEQGEKDGLQSDPDAVAQLHLLHMRVLADAESQKFIKTFQPSDADLHAEYEQDVASMDKTEYKARHILVASKEAGEQIIKKLKGGAKFEDLAKSQSTDTGSKNNGGDLGWFTTSRMVKPFADSVTALKKGEITPEPVQTQFGWHVIQLEDTREKDPPSFDQVKPQLTSQVIRKKLQAYVADLKKNDQVDKKL
jgi:peptidyl-prolyl cis-trans isomerase C